MPRSGHRVIPPRGVPAMFCGMGSRRVVVWVEESRIDGNRHISSSEAFKGSACVRDTISKMSSLALLQDRCTMSSAPAAGSRNCSRYPVGGTCGHVNVSKYLVGGVRRENREMSQ